MLNAFRHHRSLHIRLVRAGLPCTTSAQRLSASQIPSRSPGVGCGGSRGVLNAFRHLRSFHNASGMNASPRASRVLNAFRHHRSRSPVEQQAIDFVVDWCSTPFGITDPFAITDVSIRHRGDMCSTPFGITDPCTPVRSTIFHWPWPCSTPFGISPALFRDNAAVFL